MKLLDGLAKGKTRTRAQFLCWESPCGGCGHYTVLITAVTEETPTGVMQQTPGGLAETVKSSPVETVGRCQICGHGYLWGPDEDRTSFQKFAEVTSWEESLLKDEG